MASNGLLLQLNSRHKKHEARLGIFIDAEADPEYPLLNIH
jgi:hypothetical protein